MLELIKPHEMNDGRILNIRARFDVVSVGTGPSLGVTDSMRRLSRNVTANAACSGFSLDGESTIKEVGSPRRAVMKEFWCSYSVTFRGDTNSSASGSGGSHVGIAVASADGGIRSVKPLQTSTLNLRVNEGDACPAQDAAAPLLQAQSNTLEIVSVNAAGVPSMSTKERCCYVLTVLTGI
jgi:hypothetical protein